MPNSNRKPMDRVFQPYSREELALHCMDWQSESIFWGIIAQNTMLLSAAENFADFIAGNAPRPQTPLSALLRPERNPSANYSESLLRQLYALMIKSAREEISCSETLLIASRSTITLLDELEQISPTRYLVDARASIKQIFALILVQEPVQINLETYRRDLEELFSTFVKSCSLNARELTFLEEDLWHCSMKQGKTTSKKTPRSSHFSDLQRETAKKAWKAAQRNDFLLSSCSKSRLTHAMAFEYFKSELWVVGLNSLEAFNRCLESERNQHNYRYNMGKLIEDK